jgi:hypothetical protein
MNGQGVLSGGSARTGLSKAVHDAFDLGTSFLRGSAILGLGCQSRLNLDEVHSCASQVQGINPES